MSRERDRNRKMFHKGHYEVIAARFREQVSRYQDDEAYPVDTEGANKITALLELAEALATRFEFDNEEFDRMIFYERCGLVVVL
jgi:hypothetical protein